MSGKCFSVVDFGAIADGKTLNSAAFQAAVDACAAAGGGTVTVPAGAFVLSTVFLKSNVTVRLEKGAALWGSLDFYDYAPQEKIDYPAYQDASHTYFDCSMFVGRNCDNIAIVGEGVIDMRSVWDEDNVRDMGHRGPKPIALKECNNVEISGIGIYNATDLAVYFAGCENVEICNLKMRVYIDGISPDNCKNVSIHDCELESGDDGIVLKSSYTLNRLGECRDITIRDCLVKSRCSAVKFGTETNGGFYNILVENVNVIDTRITAICIESVDGAIVDGLTLRNMHVRNAGAPLFIHIGRRMRGPAGREIGQIKNILLENIVAEGPYEPYSCIEWNYNTFVKRDNLQYPWGYSTDIGSGRQFTSNACGLPGYPLENITFKNVKFCMEGGVTEWRAQVPDNNGSYPEVHVYGRPLPAVGVYFRHVKGLTLDNFTVERYNPDLREDFVFEDVEGLVIR